MSGTFIVLKVIILLLTVICVSLTLMLLKLREALEKRKCWEDVLRKRFHNLANEITILKGKLLKIERNNKNGIRNKRSD